MVFLLCTQIRVIGGRSVLLCTQITVSCEYEAISEWDGVFIAYANTSQVLLRAERTLVEAIRSGKWSFSGWYTAGMHGLVR